MGGAGTPNICDEVISVAQNYDNLYLIGSNVGSEPILKAIKKLGPERVCFGSDTPFVSMSETVDKYNNILEGKVNKKEKNKIMGENIANLFNLIN